MKDLSEKLARFALLRAARQAAAGAPAPDRLSDLAEFGGNPGKLRARVYRPDGLARGAPLVVALHGCTQSAAAYDHGSGWSRLADEHGFALLLPEQRRANNPNLCFNWFDPAHARRGGGEALSISQMVLRLVSDWELAPDKVFVTGLSAGGAMAAVMLAAYPELFAGGAIIAGLPYGSATSAAEAFQRMRGTGGPDAAGLAAAVRNASGHRGPWPTISVWHGGADATVNPSNADALVAQWAGVHGLARQAGEVERAPDGPSSRAGHERRVWRKPDGAVAIESHRIAGMGHGTPLKTSGEGAAGAAGPFMLEAGVSSTREIARFWGLDSPRQGERAEARSPASAARTDAFGADAGPADARQPAAASGAVAEADRPEGSPSSLAAHAAPAASSRPTPTVEPEARRPAASSGVLKTIEDALRAAGLMR